MDTTLATWLHGHLSYAPFYQSFFRSFTILGSAAFLTALIIILSLIFVVTFRFHKAHILLLSAIFSGFTSVAIKHIVARPRPMLWPPLEHIKSHSFPSAHAVTSVVVYGILALFLAERYPKRRILIYGIYIAIVLLVGLSRVYLGVHWPSDVVGGWAVGVLILAALIWWYRKGSIAKTVRIGIGIFSLIIGLIGIIVPILPGIPFLIAGFLLVFSDQSPSKYFAKIFKKT